MSYAGLLINTCTVINKTEDKWGEPTETLVAGVKCRIEYGNRIVKNSLGEDVLSSARVFFLKNAPIFNTSRFNFDGRDHGVQRIEWPQDSVAKHHIQVYVD